MSDSTLVFDLDGTLVDTAPDLVGALNAVLALENLAPVSLEELRRMVGAGVRVMIQRGLAAREHEVSEERFEELAAAFLVHYEHHIADESQLYPDVRDVLERYRADGVRLAVCTNKPEKLSFLLLDALDLRGYFAAVCGADTFAARKPDPSHLLGTIERAGGDVAQAIMIGDSQTDLATARAAGVPVILMSYGYTDVPAAELGADRVLADFAGVPAAARDLLAREGTA